MSDLSCWDANTILEDACYSCDINALLSGDLKGAPAEANSCAREKRCPSNLTAVLGIVVLIVAALAGGLIVVAFLALALKAAVLAASNSKGKAIPNNRSDYHRRVWADNHNFEVDSDSEHNWKADRDRPW